MYLETGVVLHLVPRYEVHLAVCAQLHKMCVSMDAFTPRPWMALADWQPCWKLFDTWHALGVSSLSSPTTRTHFVRKWSSTSLKTSTSLP